MADKIKKETEFNTQIKFCDECKRERYFYQHKSGGEWFSQLCFGPVYDETKDNESK